MEKNLDTDFVVRAVLTALSKAFDFILHDLLAIIDYCPLGQMLSTASSLKKIENLQKRALRFFCDDYEISHQNFNIICQGSGPNGFTSSNCLFL